MKKFASVVFAVAALFSSYALAQDDTATDEGGIRADVELATQPLVKPQFDQKMLIPSDARDSFRASTALLKGMGLLPTRKAVLENTLFSGDKVEEQCRELGFSSTACELLVNNAQPWRPKLPTMETEPDGNIGVAGGLCPFAHEADNEELCELEGWRMLASTSSATVSINLPSYSSSMVNAKSFLIRAKEFQEVYPSDVADEFVQLGNEMVQEARAQFRKWNVAAH